MNCIVLLCLLGTYVMDGNEHNHITGVYVVAEEKRSSVQLYQRCVRTAAWKRQCEAPAMR